jgi:hypothetical protein
MIDIVLVFFEIERYLILNELQHELVDLIKNSIDVEEFSTKDKKKSFGLVREIQVNTFDDDSRHVSIFDRVST